MRTQTENRSLTEISTRYYGADSSSAITRFEGMNEPTKYATARTIENQPKHLKVAKISSNDLKQSYN